MESERKCKFKEVCTSEYCDKCECLTCSTECTWDNKCPRDSTIVEQFKS